MSTIERPPNLPSTHQTFRLRVEDILTEGRARSNFDHVPALAKSILEKKGLIHYIVVKRSTKEGKEGKYDLVAGESRLRAYMRLCLQDHEKYSYIDCVLREDIDEIDFKELELEENVTRTDLPWPDQVKIMHEIHELKQKKFGVGGRGTDKGWTIQDTAELTGRSKSGVSHQVTFAKKLAARPDIAAQVTNLPMFQAMRAFDQKIISERTMKQVESGELKLSTNLKLGSCLDLIKEVESGTIDLVLTDPPFGNSEIEEQEGKDRGTVQSYTQMLRPDDNLNEEGVKQLITILAPELFRVLKPQSHLYLFCSMDCWNFLLTTLTSVGFDCQKWPIIWLKQGTTAPDRGYEYMPCYEPILFAHKCGLNGERRRKTLSAKAVIEFDVPSRLERIHPFQKPLPLLEFLITQSSDKGGIVFDPFAGSASVLKAATKMGRSGLGFEKDEQRFRDAQSLLIKGV